MSSNQLLRWRLGFLALALFAATSVGIALYLQYYQSVPPCPLCIFQRIGIMACGTLALAAAIMPLRPVPWFWPSAISFAALAGAGVSVQHILIQRSLATDNPQTCGGGLDYMFKLDSIPNVIASVLSGHGDCSVIDWQMFGVTLPMLSLAAFVMFAGVAWLLYRLR